MKLEYANQECLNSAKINFDDIFYDICQTKLWIGWSLRSVCRPSIAIRTDVSMFEDNLKYAVCGEIWEHKGKDQSFKK